MTTQEYATTERKVGLNDATWGRIMHDTCHMFKIILSFLFEY